MHEHELLKYMAKKTSKNQTQGDLSLWQYKNGQCPEAEKACREGINLLPDAELPAEKLEALLSQAQPV